MAEEHDWRYWAELGKQQKAASSGGSSAPGNDAIVEIRPGAGGDESALFGMELFQMYKKYAASKKWTVSVIDSSDTSIGGLKYVAFEI
jgi:peptide chain release factor 1